MSDSDYRYDVRVRGLPGAEVTFGPAYEIASDDIYASSLPTPPPEGFCRVYWGSHGCHLGRGHVQRDGTPHWCDCCECASHPDPDPDNPGSAPSCVAGPPYYGPDTRFYGEDALGLPLVSQ